MKESRGASRQSADDGDTATTTIVTISNFIYRFRFLACSICLSLSLSPHTFIYIDCFGKIKQNGDCILPVSSSQVDRRLLAVVE